MTRDSGRYDVFTNSYVDQQIRVDFAWGNIPMQPNDDRGANTLNPALDSHEIATSGYQGFPSFIRGGIYDDTIANKVVPNVVGLTEAAATTALTNVGLVKGAVTTADNAGGATSGNDGKVKTQTPAAGTTVNTGASVALVKYAYVSPGPASYPVAAIRYNMAGSNAYDMFLTGRVNKPSVGDKIFVYGNARDAFNRKWTVAAVANDDAYNTGGTKVTFSDNAGGGGTDYHVGGTWFVVPTSLPTWLPLVQRTTGEVPYANLDNNGEDGRIRLRISNSSPMYALLTSPGLDPADNAYAGKTITFSNIMSNPSTGADETYSYLNGVKTVYASSLFDMGPSSQTLDIVLADTTVVTGIGYEFYREIYGLALVSA
jgi:hypothetical protein